MDTSSTQDQEIDILALPQQPGWGVSPNLCKYQDFWCFSNFLNGIVSFQKNFIPQTDDTIICSISKSGTTWLKSLSPDKDLDSSENPLLTNLPHVLVRNQEMIHYGGHERDTRIPLISTHVPFKSLSKSIIDSNNKIIYICRNPKDILVSLWHFLCNKKSEAIKFEEAYEKFSNGVSLYGPYWDHMLGYWKASLEFPHKVLFLKYEDMKSDTFFYMKKIADFMCCPFSFEEEKQGVVEKIVQMYSFENLSNLEVNKGKNTNKYNPIEIDNNLYFRKGEVGDWKNYFTAEMTERLDQISEEKFSVLA